MDQHLIVGDTLFVFGAGHCTMPGGDVREFYHSMQKLKLVDDEAMLHCGHDYGCKIETTMGEQKAGNAYLVIDNEEDFVRFVEGMSQGLVAYPTNALTKKEILAML
ncbi:metallo-beta-lactamase family protein [hydrothermal vent metagenome]|uniref:Metallo-beta-lactamase family protein n=1 Tax=hydrothermal vent metagenome TaxID=652676 RepID=A0A1W1DTJ4_9ZZZZ